jgi:1-deoxy-D-xylulose-5-phosphate reductoisomerase
VEYADGSVLAQISTTDMRMPIQYALTYPERKASPVPRLRWDVAGNWGFYPPDMRKFPLLKLAYQAQEAGGSVPCTLNAADEIAVESFLRGEISFLQIARIVEETLARMGSRPAGSVEEVLEIDRQSRAMARRLIDGEIRSVTVSGAGSKRAAV